MTADYCLLLMADRLTAMLCLLPVVPTSLRRDGQRLHTTYLLLPAATIPTLKYHYLPTAALLLLAVRSKAAVGM